MMDISVEEEMAWGRDVGAERLVIRVLAIRAGMVRDKLPRLHSTAQSYTYSHDDDDVFTSRYIIGYECKYLYW